MSKSPPDWAVGPHNDIEDGIEVRENADGTIDEVVSHVPVRFHLEQMDDGQYYIGLSWKRGRKQCSQLMMLTREGKHIYPTVYR